MTKEQVQERLKILQQDSENARAAFLACQGAIQDCQYWLNRFEETNGEAKSE